MKSILALLLAMAVMPTHAAEAKAAAKPDPAKGQAISTQVCVACHTFDKGGRNLVGPNLWGIVGKPKASDPAFNYSAAMKGQKSNWTLDDLDAYLKNPRGMVPGTNMSFVGIPRASERADLLAFLNAKSDKPAPLPKAAELAPTPAR